MKNNTKVYAAILVIGNEILSGKTHDKNINFIALRLKKIGIILREVRVIRDDKFEIINNVKELSKKNDHVFTTGGIGPTHDDITASAIADAFNDKMVLNQQALKLLENHYINSGVELNDSRKKMAYIPSKADLIANLVSAAPGFHLENVWVMAGVPKIMQSMFKEDIEKRLNKGKPIISRSVKVLKAEGDIANYLNKVVKLNERIEIGSYPFYRPPEIGTTIIFSGTSLKEIENLIKVLCKYLTKAKIHFSIEKT